MTSSGRLFAQSHGQGATLVLVHGFTQTGRSWDALASVWQERYRVVTVDAPGHGRSGSVLVGLGTGADLLARAGGLGSYVGYSMGGRLCLHLGLRHPEVVESLVLVGTTAGISDPIERRERQRQDDELAGRVEDHGIDAFLHEWLSRPLFAGLTEGARGLEARRENTAEGLASSLRLAGTGRQEPLWDRLAELAMPVLIVAGSNDPKFSDLGRRLTQSIGDNATFASVPGAGHAAHLENPQYFARLVEDFLSP
ncbi:MAG: alpha/beta fold hydrolase [Acidimicrobiales bacterium]